MAKGIKTIEELVRRCRKLKVPLASLKVSIGEKTSQPGFIVVCREGDEYVMYRNRRDGGRTERYRGRVEATAVDLMLAKLHDLACAELVRCGDTGEEPLFWARNLAGDDASNYRVSNPAQPDYSEAREGAEILFNMTMSAGTARTVLPRRSRRR